MWAVCTGRSRTRYGPNCLLSSGVEVKNAIKSLPINTAGFMIRTVKQILLKGIKERRMRRVGHVARMGDSRGAYRVSVG